MTASAPLDPVTMLSDISPSTVTATPRPRAVGRTTSRAGLVVGRGVRSTLVISGGAWEPTSITERCR
jgi:hypothetical protein